MTERRAIAQNGLGLTVGAFALVLGLVGCGDKSREADAEQLDNALVGTANDADPALTSALEDQIMVDPALTQQANGTSARPADTPIQAPIPATSEPGKGGVPTPKGLLRAPEATATTAGENPTLGELAKAQGSAGGMGKDCHKNLQFSVAWAERLPADLPLYPAAQVSEAAGNAAPGCGLRVISFTSAAPVQMMLDWYYTKATKAGFSGEHKISRGDHVLAGTRGNNAYYLMTRPKQGGGSESDLIVNYGR